MVYNNWLQQRWSTRHNGNTDVNEVGWNWKYWPMAGYYTTWWNTMRNVTTTTTTTTTTTNLCPSRAATHSSCDVCWLRSRFPLDGLRPRSLCSRSNARWRRELKTPSSCCAVVPCAQSVSSPNTIQHVGMWSHLPPGCGTLHEKLSSDSQTPKCLFKTVAVITRNIFEVLPIIIIIIIRLTIQRCTKHKPHSMSITQKVSRIYEKNWKYQSNIVSGSCFRSEIQKRELTTYLSS